MFNHFYPETNFHELNLDYILREIRRLASTVESWIVVSEVKFAEPITWDASRYYPKNTIVLGLDGNTYLAKKDVPLGMPTTEGSYWLKIGNYNAQLTDVSNRLVEVEDDIETLQADVDVLAKRVTSVTYTQFGAVLDGVTDDSGAVLACHAYANEHGCRVEQHSGKLLLNFTVDVLTDCDFTGLDFIMYNDTPLICYNIPHDEIETPELFSFTISNASDVTPSEVLTGKFCVPYVESNDTIISKRTVGTPVVYYHRQPLVIDPLGHRITAPYYLDAVTAPFVLRGYSDITEKGVEFKGGHVIVNRSVRGFSALVQVNRNNCKVRDITAEAISVPSSSEQPHSGLVHFYQCANGLADGLSVNNYSEDIDRSDPYVITAYECYNIALNNIYAVTGWGVTATYFVDTFKVTNSVVNRVDVHYGAFGSVMVDNVTLAGGVNSINLGYGHADLNITNVSNSVNPQMTSALVVLRSDLIDFFNGSINIANVTAHNKNLIGCNAYKQPEGEVYTRNPKIVYSEYPIIQINNVALSGKVKVITSAGEVQERSPRVIDGTNSTLNPRLRVYSCRIDDLNFHIPSQAEIYGCHCNSVNCVGDANIYSSRVYADIVASGSVNAFGCLIGSNAGGTIDAGGAITLQSCRVVSPSSGDVYTIKTGDSSKYINVHNSSASNPIATSGTSRKVIENSFQFS